ncbi:Dps family protein [Rhizosphaericola mali]|uniref:DNA starvation/stationary phase protection protein n=1 Tax=Rhizosphaericola mali TaxID=2545455 RepID=A0A5P2GEP5_9BACT|nr:DNA starvation/stationary phase protection protein [Rhizosphaericola mali]QES90081.1 DNA starvation/stationary phase protection protein [Rhizosphaericola mali]
MEAQIGIKQEFLLQVAISLGKVLADEFVLYTKTRKAHWCVTGSDFHSKHLFFEAQYNQLADIIDDVAERIRSLGHFPPATLKEYLELTHLTEQSREKNDSLGYIKELLSDHESILIHLRENIDGYANALKDAGSSDYITGLMETHEKMAWMLRAHLD